MNKQTIMLLVFLSVFLAAIIGGGVFLSQKSSVQVVAVPVPVARSGGEGGGGSDNSSSDNSDLALNSDASTEKEMADLTRQAMTEIRSEQRLNLGMSAQLRTYRTMLQQVQEYATNIENDIELTREISQKDFQENVELQAGLFSGKKPELVARHLEEFDPARVGAILSKMKEKEASSVMDVWAIAPPAGKNPRFYTDVMAAYLKSRRHDMNPELFSSLEDPSKP